MSEGSVGKALEIQQHSGIDIFDKLVQILIFEDTQNDENIWELITAKHNFETTKDYHKFLFNLLLSAIAQISKSLVTKQKSFLINTNINNTNDDEKYFPYSLIYSIIIEDFNEALKVNLSLADILFTSFLKINKITKDLKLV
jgi:hypothetical protein